MSSILKQKFYLQDTTTVAKNLLGKRLVRIYKGKRISGIITETEAYLGLSDKACHSFSGKKTDRVLPLYMAGGHAYVYFIYGMHFCFNVVTRSEGIPEAVLIRALEPDEGIEQMQSWRGQTNIKNLTTGPAKLCEALHIERELNAKSLIPSQKVKSPIFLEEGLKISKSQIVARPRINIDYAEEAIDWPLRFYLKDSQFISKK